ncbi:hypothetical protein KM1_081880 [Entamoeba histolytica HM-3:IMSS]|uniref:Uncharacterized protein n=1 Tax=Entamoeba histolytica HM-3:IMSS TaxID=885315 RepID=M7WB18_ENTHI|nr:hypothetical protein KM1_081880 [Entamoeba histolytica HM-3:IMSS]
MNNKETKKQELLFEMKYQSYMILFDQKWDSLKYSPSPIQPVKPSPSKHKLQ